MPTGRTVRARLLVRGIVQGVGFRPFTARLARRLDLVGGVRNTTRGVEIEVQGAAADVEAFERELRGSPPPMAMLLSVGREELPPAEGDASFEIRTSRADPAASVIVPPDIGLCAACRAEIDDPADRRHDYPFVNCTDCGPRYTVIRSVPYDRPRTSMAGFALCPDCEREYRDPEDRRFHAQPVACPACGPRLTLRGRSDGAELPGDPLAEASASLRAGGIVALLGIGGFHLACNADDEAAVSRLRERKKRPAKPLAVMAANMGAAEEAAELDEESRRLLLSPAAPILICPARRPSPLAPSVAPGQESVGLFLPYTPLHHLLFRRCGLPRLVMTSGNRSDEPILSTWEEAREKLLGVADLFLVHDRPIVHPVDDSVVKRMGRLGVAPVRRARGYAPRPIPLPAAPSGVTLALGAELLVTVTVAREGLAFVGPHVGDLKNPETEDGFRRGAEHLLDLLQARPDRVACDLHPSYRSTACAEAWEKRGLPLTRVQHHEAHGAACMAENGFSGEGIVLALDGVGLGSDRTLWGGEILAGRPGSFRRAGHLAQVPQPGGDRAAVEPWRMAASHLRRLLGERWMELPLPALRDQGEETLRLLDAMMAKGVNAPLTSSCGRLFDAAAAILGFRGRILYTAQAPMELEAAAARARPSGTDLPAGTVREEAGTILLDPGPILLDLLDGTTGGRPRDEAARRFHDALADLFALGARLAAESAGFRDVFLTGGCLQNAILSEELDRRLSAEGLRVYHHRLVPANDGGVSYGQAAWLALSGK